MELHIFTVNIPIHRLPDSLFIYLTSATIKLHSHELDDVDSWCYRTSFLYEIMAITIFYAVLKSTSNTYMIVYVVFLRNEEFTFCKQFLI